MAMALLKELYVAPFHRLEALLGDLLRRMEEGDPFRPRRVVVISNLVRDRLQERLARGGAFAGVDFLTPRDLAARIAGPRLDREGLQPLPAGAGAALASRLLRESRPRLRRLQPPPGVPGYDEALAASLADLREAGLTAGGLRRFRSKDAGATQRVKEVALLLAGCERRLAELGLYDEPGLLRAACEEAEASPPGVPTVLYGFADLNPLQRRLLAACCHGAPAAALVPAEEGAPACAFAVPLIAWLRSLGFADREAPEGGARPFAAAGRALFGAGEAAELPGGALRVVSAPAASREAFELLREVLHSPASPDGGEAAVLLPAGESYPPLFEETCRSLGVGARAGRGAPLARTPAGRAFLRLLALRERGFPRAELLRFLGEGRFAESPRFMEWRAAEGLEEDPLLPARWERLSRELPYAAGEEGWRRAIAWTKKEETAASAGTGPASLLHGFEAALDILFEGLRALPARGPLSRHAEAAARALEGLTGPLGGKERAAAALRELAGWDPLLGEVENGEFQRWARLALERPAPGGPAGPARVRLLSLREARGLSFGTVVLPGMAEGVFPVRGREDPLLPDALRKELGAALAPGSGPPLLPLKGERMAEERYLFWLALQSAERRAVLGVPRAGGGALEGSERPPSLFLHHLAAAVGIAEEGEGGLPRFGGSILRAASPGLDKGSLERPVSLLEGDLGAIASQLPPALAAKGALAHLGARPGFARRRQALDDRWRRGALTAQDGLLADGDVLGALRSRLRPGERPVPVTALETFFGCPYRFALERLLGLASRPEPAPPLEADGALRGSLFHSALRRFFTALLGGKRGAADLTEAELREMSAGAAADAFREAEKEGKALLPLPWRLLRTAVERQLEGFLRSAYGEDERGWRPERAERGFGREDALAVEIAGAAGRRLLVSGRYDLLERSKEGEYRFVDFKSGESAGSVPKRGDPLGGGRWLQPHLYARHGRQALGEDARIGAAYAFVTERMGYRLFSLSPEAIEALGRRVDGLLGYFLRAAEEGAFFPVPSPACAYCDFVAVCGPERGPRAERKAGDRRRAELLRLQEKPR